MRGVGAGGAVGGWVGGRLGGGGLCEYVHEGPSKIHEPRPTRTQLHTPVPQHANRLGP